MKQKAKIILFFVTLSLLTVFNFDFGSKPHRVVRVTQSLGDSTSIVFKAMNGYHRSGQNSNGGESFQNKKSVMAYNLIFYVFYEFLKNNPVKGQ